MAVRVLLLADTHLGIDLPARPRVERARRGDDFFANFRAALEPALRGEVDLVVHGGDLLYRSKVRPWLVQLAFAPLFEVARRIPVVLVPGNHERSAIPFPLFGAHRNIHVLDRPRTVQLALAGTQVAVSGFPFVADAGARFGSLLGATGWREREAALRLLCLHQAIEGARVGPSGYTFRPGPEVIAGRQLPAGFDAFLSGHIHRAQVLLADLAGRPLPAPVIYPGSVERTSFAERNERKGYVLLELAPGEPVRRRFVELPARPMVDLAIESGPGAEDRLRRALSQVPARAFVRVRLDGAELSEARARSLAPAEAGLLISISRPGLRTLREEAP
jgi:exonuclease SbcD